MMKLPLLTIAVLFCIFSTSACVRLDVVQDVTIHRAVNLGHKESLKVGRLPSSSPAIVRSLLQFENVTSTCTTLSSATLHVYYAGFESGNPPQSRTLKVHQVKKPWLETEATAIKRLTNEEWGEVSVAVDDTDVAMNGYPSDGVIVNTNSAAGFKEFVITDIVQNWKDTKGKTNYGVLLRVTTDESGSGIIFRFGSDEAPADKHAYIEANCN